MTSIASLDPCQLRSKWWRSFLSRIVVRCFRQSDCLEPFNFCLAGMADGPTMLCLLHISGRRSVIVWSGSTHGLRDLFTFLVASQMEPALEKGRSMDGDGRELGAGSCRTCSKMWIVRTVCNLYLPPIPSFLTYPTYPTYIHIHTCTHTHTSINAYHTCTHPFTTAPQADRNGRPCLWSLAIQSCTTWCFQCFFGMSQGLTLSRFVLQHQDIQEAMCVCRYMCIFLYLYLYTHTHIYIYIQLYRCISSWLPCTHAYRNAQKHLFLKPLSFTMQLCIYMQFRWRWNGRERERERSILICPKIAHTPVAWSITCIYVYLH